MGMDFEDCYPVLVAMRGSHPFKVRGWETAQKRFRAFADRFIRPIALTVDRKNREDHDYLNWDFCRRAAEERMFSVMIPPMFGGQGGDVFTLAIMLEELCAACTGLANVVGAHYLGYSGLAAGMNLDLLGRISEDIVAGERRGEPIMMSAAHTEPSAGSDVEDEEMMPKARVVTSAVRKNGGWVLNGQKVFISDGHFATWHMVSAYRDKRDPLKSGMGVIVRTGDPGFSMVKHELKMGQRACPASTLVFEDCFVPDNMVISDVPEFFERILFVLGASRVGVAAIGTGCARGAFEQALKIAQTERFQGRFLVDEQWVQQILADMLANVMIGRALYISAGLCGARNGMMGLMTNPVMAIFQKLIPDALLLSPAYQKILRSRFMSKLMNKAVERIELKSRQRDQAHSCAGKLVATDLAMRNANLALEIAGAAGLEHEAGVEKFFRDAKLLQIYEGTNQINRKHLWDSIIARNTTM
jgi:alkylation response protein AidB-like acyl-CoA dehydrogenase